MGVMTGKVLPNEFVVMDVIPLPVEGTETRVNAMAEGYEYMVNYVTSLNKIGRNENVIGWYHSHPGYGCWLSGIDVNTQRQSQTFQDPFLALVIDPNCTIAAGKVEIGAFRTYPLNSQGRPIKTAEKASSASKIASAAQIKSTKSQAIPSAKIKDFGVHADFYYQLPITYFKSNLDSKLLDLLWNKYWTSTLSQSPLLSNYDYATRQIQENALKTDAATEALARQLNAIHENAAFHISSSLPKPKASSSDSFASATTINSEGIYMEPHSLTSGHSGKEGKETRDSGKTVFIPTYALIGTAIHNTERHGDANVTAPGSSGATSSSGTVSVTSMRGVTNKKKKTSSSSSTASSEETANSSKKSEKIKLPGNLALSVKKSDTRPFNYFNGVGSSMSARSEITSEAQAGVSMEFKEAVLGSVRTGNDQLHGLISQELRDQLFSTILTHKCDHQH